MGKTPHPTPHTPHPAPCPHEKLFAANPTYRLRRHWRSGVAIT
ncbi:MAG: hypothetical protein O9295_08810 [Microcystis sp. LE18-22.4A]|nr:hypothetical protein [Microcystis sp. LE18-22.4A]